MGGRPNTIQILHVDDERGFVDMAAEFLERADDRFTVETATSASEGLDRLAENDIDCIVSDYDMPGTDGIEFLEAVREEHPDLPFVLFTGTGSEEVASEALSAGATEYLQKGEDTDQSDLLANRVRNAVEQHRSSQQAANLERIGALVRKINQALLRANSHEEIETRVCEIISDSEPYRFAWIGEHDPDTRTVEPRTWAGSERGYLETIQITTDDRPTGQGPTARAIQSGDLAVVQNIPECDTYDPWREAALERGYRSSAAIPLVYDETRYGVLNVYADRTGAFDERERELLRELGGDIGHALRHQEAQRELRLFREAVEASGHSIYFTDTDGTIEYVNPAFEELTEYAAEEAIGHTPRILQSGEHDSDFYRVLWETILSGDCWRSEIVNATKSGDQYVVDQTIAPVTDESGEIDRFVAVNVDITEREERERDLERYETMVNTASDMVYILDTDGRFAFVNDAAETLTGYSRDRLLSAHVDLIMDEDDIETGRQLIADLCRADGQEQVNDAFEWTLHTADEDTVPCESHIALLYDDDEWVGTVGVVRDVTERKRRERELERQNERLEDFASVVSHDLRNPLAVAAGRLEMVSEDCDSDHVAAVARALERMETLIDDLLALAREGDGTQTVGDIDLAEIAEDCWQTVETRTATLVVETERSIRADRSRLKQVLANLFRNAIDHGGDDVTVTVGDLDGGFYVADDGPGIPADAREQVFDAGYSTARQGTGLGLSIVADIVDAHGWTITLTDGEDGGARVEIAGVESAD
jgi:PAS domain S-box-containing protein